MTMSHLFPTHNNHQTTLGEAIQDIKNEDEEELKYLLDALTPPKKVGITLHKMPLNPDTVSYTHLTLPTVLPV